MFLPEISIKRPVLATVMSLAIILIGVITFLRLPVLHQKITSSA